METHAMDTILQPQQPSTSHATRRVAARAEVFAFLGGPFAWFAHLLISYGLVYVPCAVRLPLLLLVTFVLGAIAIAAGVVSWRLLQQSPAPGSVSPYGGRARFFGYGGLLNSVLFLLIILAEGAAALVLGGCG